MRISNLLLRWNVYLLLILNYGYVNLVIPLAYPVPIFYLLTLPYLIGKTSMHSLLHFLKRKEILFLYPLVFVWVGHLIFSEVLSNLYVIRDGTIIIDLFFLYVGYIFMRHSSDRLNSFLSALFFLGTIYASLYLFRGFLFQISPVVGALKPVALLGSFSTVAYVSLGAIFYYLGSPKFIHILLISINVMYIMLIQSRVVFLLFFIALPVYLYKYKNIGTRKILQIVSLGFLLIVVFLFAIESFDLELEGRHGTLSFDLLHAEFLSMIGEGNLKGPAYGLQQRLSWWTTLFEQSFETVPRFLVGRGMGMALTDFRDPTGTIVREPHNSYITIYLRFGLVGIISFLFFHILVISQVVRSLGEFSLEIRTLFFIYVAMLFNGLFQPVFEFSYFAVPIYFLCGIFMFRGESDEEITRSY